MRCNVADLGLRMGAPVRCDAPVAVAVQLRAGREVGWVALCPECLRFWQAQTVPVGCAIVFEYGDAAADRMAVHDAMARAGAGVRPS